LRETLNSRALPRLEKSSPEWTEYELLDTGAGRKLERFGAVTLARPEAQAKWAPALPKKQWDAAQAEFALAGLGRKGEWKFARHAPKPWEMRRRELAFWVAPTPAGHVGVFPDQASHWDWMSTLIESAADPPRILSLFGYTGLATLVCAAAGAQVTHVDASKKAVGWARENQALSKLEERPIRWLVDDALTFVAREMRRGRTYEGLILDPPRFGRGPKSELWKVEQALPELLRGCRKLLSATPLFVLLNTYSTVLTRGQTSAEAAQLETLLREMLHGLSAQITLGELVLKDRAGRQISCSVFARARFPFSAAS
jgi:23S rRNA (cytosine1962-C5)-methyltransferase